MKKVLLFLAVAGFFAACGTKATDTPTDSQTETPNVEETVTPTAETGTATQIQ
ncbi:MAG: hypothetical protein LBR17_04315 [Bacteroidales bacterium]|nr:hypothetical protein [Bacteroidales bacterium]